VLEVTLIVQVNVSAMMRPNMISDERSIGFKLVRVSDVSGGLADSSACCIIVCCPVCFEPATLTIVVVHSHQLAAAYDWSRASQLACRKEGERCLQL
jgi:hypothetical protein